MTQKQTNKEKKNTHRKNGSVFAETAIGIMLLIPVFFLLVYVIGMVLAQSINDDLAKQAARYAGETPLVMTQATLPAPDITTMQNNATQAAQDYINNTPYANNAIAWVTNAQMIGNSLTFQAAVTGGYQVTVTTQVTYHTPGSLFGVLPATYNFQASTTEPVTTIPIGL